MGDQLFRVTNAEVLVHEDPATGKAVEYSIKLTVEGREALAFYFPERVARMVAAALQQPNQPLPASFELFARLLRRSGLGLWCAVVARVDESGHGVGELHTHELPPQECDLTDVLLLWPHFRDEGVSLFVAGRVFRDLEEHERRATEKAAQMRRQKAFEDHFTLKMKI